MQNLKCSSDHQHFSLFRLAFCVLFLFVTIPGHATEVTATLSGTVRDSSGAVVSGAKVTLTNVATNVSKTLRTDGGGGYLFNLVPIGNYRVTTEQPGFKSYIREGIVLNVNQNAKLDIELSPGEVKEVIEVQGDVTQVDTASAMLGSVETERRIVDLPLVERDTLQLGLLQAGVFPADDDDGSGNLFSVSGQRSESLSYMINGADNNDFLGNNNVVDPNPDAVAEFKILTNNYTAEFGRTSGGIVNQVIKSGTNGFHGTVFEFFRNDALNSRNYFEPVVTDYKRNIFGATIGGPIVRDRTFFFVSFQGLRRHEGQVAPTLQVLSQPERSGDFSDFLNPDPAAQFSPCPNPQAGDPVFEGGTLFDPTQLSSTCADGTQVSATPFKNNQVPVNPVIKNYIAKYVPPPNVGTNGFNSSPLSIINDDQGIVRIDHRIGGSDSIYASYIIDDMRQNLPFRIVNGGSTGGNVPTGSGFDEPIRTQFGSISWLHNFNPTTVNEFIFGANRSATLAAAPHDHSSPSALGFTNVNPDDPNGTAPPIMLLQAGQFNLGPPPGGPTTFHDVTFNWQDNLSMTRGHHDLKFGADIRRVRNNFRFDFFNNGGFDFGNFLAPFTGNALSDFVGGFFDNYSQYSRAVYGIRTTSCHFYGQDAWKLTRRLTLNYGLRYEYNTPLIDPHNEILGFFPGKQSTAFPTAPPNILYPGDPGIPNKALTYPDRNNFAPRFGFALDVFGNAKFVMRGGFGIFYDIEDGALNEQFGGEPPFGFIANINPSSYTGLGGVDTIGDPFTPFGAVNEFPSAGKPLQFGVDPLISFAYVVDPHFRTPYSENFNFGFQYQLPKDTMVEAYYVGSLTRKAISTVDVNPPLVSILQAQYASAGFTYADCARPLAGCSDPTNPNDLNSFPTLSGQLFTNKSIASGDSHQLQLTVDRRFGHGFNLRGAYTLAKTIDMQSGFRYNNSVFTDPFNFAFDRGLANFDVRQRLVISGLWQIPWDKPFRGGNAFLRRLTEGWQINGIAEFQTGTPFTIYSNSNSSQEHTGFDRADLVGTKHVFNPRKIQQFTADCNPGAAAGNFFFDPTAYDCTGVPVFTFGNSGRNSVRGPGRNDFAFSIFKAIKVGESKSFEFRTEFFNAFNHTNFMNPNHFGGNSLFGQVTQARDPRLIQLALKFYY